MGIFSSLIPKREIVGKCICCGCDIEGIKGVSKDKQAVTPCLKIKKAKFICEKCLEKSGLTLKITGMLEEKGLIDVLLSHGIDVRDIVGFYPTKTIDGVKCVLDDMPQKRSFPAIAIDDNRGLIRFYYSEGFGDRYKVVDRNIQDIIDFELSFLG